MRGSLDVREIEDIGETALSYGVIWTTYVLPRAESIGGQAPQRVWSFALAARCGGDIGARKRSVSGTGRMVVGRQGVAAQVVRATQSGRRVASVR
jgi:hypothetical protein